MRSWRRLEPQAEIILYGDDPGVGDRARELGVRHVPGLRCNEYGTPLLSDLFERAQRDATYDWLCYVNSDIVLGTDFLEAVERLPSKPDRPLLMSGRRWRVGIVRPLDVDADGWEEQWRADVERVGSRDSAQCMDYFVFRRGLIRDFPPFAIGRTRWDSYLPYSVLERRGWLIDASDVVFAVHQNHEYPGGVQKAGLRDNPEHARNRALASPDQKATLADATHRLTARRLKRERDFIRIRYGLYKLWRRPILGFPVRVMLKTFGTEAKARLVR